MSITKLTTNGIVGAKYDTISADNYYIEPIATTLLSGTQATISFTNIPQGYKHLQLRVLARTNRASNTQSNMLIQFNSDTGSNYYPYHSIDGDGSTAVASVSGTGTNINVNRLSGATADANIYGTIIVDMLDYQNTNKYKTTRSLGGIDLNGTGVVNFSSGLWLNTSPINRLDITTLSGTASFIANSRFSLYGIRG
jgi:hypothetical protein